MVESTTWIGKAKETSSMTKDYLRDKLTLSSFGTQDVHYDILQKTQRLFESVWSKGDKRLAKELIPEDCNIFECGSPQFNIPAGVQGYMTGQLLEKSIP